MGEGWAEIYNDDDYVEVGEALDFAHYLLSRLGVGLLTKQEVRAIFEDFLVGHEEI